MTARTRPPMSPTAPPRRARLTLLALLTLLPAAASAQDAARDADLAALGGEWLYVRELTEGRAPEDQGPPMSVTFGLRVEEGAVVMERSAGREERIPIDGSVEEIPEGDSITRRLGRWEDGTLAYRLERVSAADGTLHLLILREFRVTPEGLLVRVVLDDVTQPGKLALYRHPEDIELPTPAAATVDDLAWLAGAWVGTRGSSSTDERWGPPLGGAMLGTSRTLRNGAMVGFEFLRIGERDGGLVYHAQPGGRHPATEFVLTELGPSRAVFENPRHDSPQRIVYELSDEGALSASIGFIHGGRPRVFEFTREGE